MTDCVVQRFASAPALRRLHAERLAGLLAGQGLAGLALRVLRHRGDLAGLGSRPGRELAFAADEAERRGSRAAEGAGRLLLDLRGRGIPALPLKGADFFLRSGMDPSLRRMGDIDIIVPPGYRERAVAVLTELGFRPPDRKFTSDFSRYHHAQPLEAEEYGGEVQVHDAFEAGAVEPEYLEAVFQRTNSAGPHLLLERADSAIFVAAHAARHGFRAPLRVVFDLQLLLGDGDPLGADAVERAARCYGRVDALLAFRLAAALTSTVLGSPLPGVVLPFHPRRTMLLWACRHLAFSSARNRPAAKRLEELVRRQLHPYQRLERRIARLIRRLSHSRP